MTQTASPAPGWRRIVPLLAFGILVAAVLLRVRNGPTTSEAAGDITAEIRYFGSGVLWIAGPGILVAALLLHARRFRLLAWIALLAIVSSIVGEFFMSFIVDRSDRYSTAYLFWHYYHLYVTVAAQYLTLTMLLVFPRLDRGVLVRQIAVGAIVAHYVLWLFELLPYPALNATIDWLRTIAIVVELVTVPLVAWYSMQRRAESRSLVSAAPGNVSLTCPRCNTLQIVPTDGAHCPNCRLPITITLESSS